MELKNNNILAFGTALAFVLSQGGAVYGSTGYSKVGVIPSKKISKTSTATSVGGTCFVGGATYTLKYPIKKNKTKKNKTTNCPMVISKVSALPNSKKFYSKSKKPVHYVVKYKNGKTYYAKHPNSITYYNGCFYVYDFIDFNKKAGNQIIKISKTGKVLAKIPYQNQNGKTLPINSFTYYKNVNGVPNFLIARAKVVSGKKACYEYRLAEYKNGKFIDTGKFFRTQKMFHSYAHDNEIVFDAKTNKMYGSYFEYNRKNGKDTKYIKKNWIYGFNADVSKFNGRENKAIVSKYIVPRHKEEKIEIEGLDVIGGKIYAGVNLDPKPEMDGYYRIK